MATTPDIKLDVKFDADQMRAALVRARRHLAGTGIAVELSSQVSEDQIESVLDTLRTNAGHAKSSADARWIAEITPNFERMVTDGLAWLVATREYLDEITTDTMTEDEHLATEGKI